MREITKTTRERHKKIKVSLKKENEILKELGKYLFQLVNASSDMFFYYNKKLNILEQKRKYWESKYKKLRNK